LRNLLPPYPWDLIEDDNSPNNVVGENLRSRNYTLSYLGLYKLSNHVETYEMQAVILAKK
jgi:hypothetical protein